MKLPSRRINIEDLKGAPNWVPPMVSTINLGNEDLVRAVNGRLVVGENINGLVTTVTFTTPSDYATGGFPALQFSYTAAIRPSCLLIGSISGPSPILSPTSLTWSYNNSVTPNLVRVTYVAGLAASTTYTMTLLAL